MMDSRDLKRIDAMEIYTIFLMLGKADYDSVLECSVDVFTTDTAGSMTRPELMSFLDSLFRAFSKLLIVRGETAPTDVNVRLAAKDLKELAQAIIPENAIKKGDFCKYLPGNSEPLKQSHC